MDEFPFSEDEWKATSDASLQIVNATFVKDEILREASFVELRAVLEELRDRHGEHPVLLETEADFTHDAESKAALYERAKSLALQHGLPTFTIRISLAGVLLEELKRAAAARAELLACREEMEEGDDDWFRDQWRELLTSCERALAKRD